MATTKLTLIGLYNYDGTLFDGLQLPEYFDKQTLVNTILLAGGEFPCLYPNGDFMKQAITLWSGKNQRYFDRLAILMQKDYDPLENYNRREEWDDTGEGSSSSQYTNSNTETGQVSAYNSSAFENRDKTTGSDSGNSSGSSEYENHREGFARGNIGVTTSQEMFRQEMEIVSLSPYDVIAGDFINEFCIKIYL